MEELTLKAYGKINLVLDVLGQRPDGYHEVRMIMQNVGLHDTVTLERTKEAGISMTCSAPGIPTDHRNLMMRAASALFQEKHLPGGLRMTLEKHLPAAAGMAGGSSDAAAVFRGINQLFELGMDADSLSAIGVRLGADIPFCIHGGTCLSEGIGEILTILPPMPKCFLLLAKPDIAVSTKEVYEGLSGIPAAKIHHPDVDAVLEAVKSSDLSGISRNLGNLLESVTVKKHPEVGLIKEKMRSMSAENALMSGSGPTVFGIFRDRGAAEACLNYFRSSEGRKLAPMSELTEPMEEMRFG